MNCKEVKEKLLFYLDDELDGKERQAVERHLTTCAYCREELEALSETQSILKRSFESISSRNAPVWAWAELESRLAMTDNISPTLISQVVSIIRGFLSWKPRWKPVLTGILTIVLIVTSAFCISNAFSPTAEAKASEIVNDTPEVRALADGTPVVEAIKVFGTNAYVLSNGSSGESNLAYVDLKEGVVTRLFRLTVPPFTETDKSEVIDIANADPDVQQILSSGGRMTDVYQLAPRLRLEIIDGKPAVWSEGILANAVLKLGERKWIARVNVSEGKVISVSELSTTPHPPDSNKPVDPPYSKEELIEIAEADARVSFLLDRGAEIAHVATGSRRMANTGAVILKLGDDIWSARIDLDTRAVLHVELVPKAKHGKSDLFNPV